MRRVVIGLLLALAVVVPAAADKAKDLYNKGRDAEARQKYQEAYDFYRQAYELKPKEIRYRSAYQRSRFEAAASHVKRGQELREDGKLEESLAEFEKAASIDPTLFVARQEVQRTREMIEKAKGTPQSTVPPKRENELSRMVAQAEGPVELKPISNTPITLRMTEDTKVIYSTIGKLAGINVLFDPDYVSRRLSIELNNVSLYQALEIVALQSKTFYRPVTPNTIFVASDTKAKRTEIEQSVIKTFYFSNLSQTTEIQDLMNAMRTVLEIQRVIPLTSQSAIVVRGTPDQIALAQKLVDDLDKAKSEVIVEVAVMQVRRDKLRNLGVNPPSTATIQLQGNVQSTTTTTSGTTTPTTTTTTPGTVTLNKLANLDARDFVVTIPQASVAFLASDSTTKVIQNPQIRALDGQKASLKIGDRVPVATGSFQPGIGGVGINPLVNTQFQYIDVGVNIDITPRVHAGREVTLKMVLEISAVTSRVNIGGIDQPVIGQRRVEHEIRLKEGEVNLLGGILEEQDIKSLSGWPWISQVPILKYFFSQENKERIENEIVFALVPHVIRGQELSELNTRVLDVGTAQAIELRRGGGAAPANQTPAATPPGAAATPATQVPAPQQQPSVVPAPAPQMPAPAPSGSALATGGAILGFDPAQVSQPVNSTFVVNVMITGHNLYSVPVQMSYDPRMLQLVNVSNGGFLGRDGQAVALVHRDDPASGSLQVNATRPPGTAGVSGEGAVFTLTFLAKAAGQSTLSITRALARDPNMQALPATGGQAMITVK